MTEQRVQHSPQDDDDQPLAGWNIVVTRAEEQADSLVERLRKLGANPIAYPTIRCIPPEDPRPIDEAIRRARQGAYDWIVLTSVNAVRAIHERWETIKREAEEGTSETVVPGANQALFPARLAAVGPATTAACRELLGATPAVVPKKFVAEALAEALGTMHGQRVLLANADIARPVLQHLLQQAGAVVERVIAYRTVPATGGADLPKLLAQGKVDAITFTSGSTIRYFLDRIGPEAIADARKTVIACIGPIAAETAHHVGLPPTVVADPYTEEGLVNALINYARTQR